MLISLITLFVLVNVISAAMRSGFGGAPIESTYTQTVITSCPYTINSPGTYELNQNISSTGTCITINTDNVELDCKGYTIDGIDEIDSYGIDNPGFNNLEIKNCVITDFFYGIRFTGDFSKIIDNMVNSNNDTGILLEYSFNNNITNNNVSSNTYYGIWLYSSSNNNLTNNIVNSNGEMGIVLQDNSNNNLIYNNFFNNTINAADDGYNSWNILDPSLVGSWHFDEGSGTIAYDFSGNNNHGTLVNNPAWVEGKFRKALEFDGVNDYIDVGSDSSLKMTDEITVEAWVKIASFPFPDGYHNVLSDHSPSYNNGKILRFSNNDIQFLLGAAGTETVNFTFNSSAAGNWQHLAATYNGSMMKLYVNGVLVDSISRTGSIAANPNPIWIGKSGWGEYFNGAIDEVRIYNRALTQDEILSDFQHGAIKKLGKSIIGGPYLGGNYWDDYTGEDLDGDWIGDTDLPYASPGSEEHIEEGGDYVPPTMPQCKIIHGIINLTACGKTYPLSNVKVTLVNETGDSHVTYTDGKGTYEVSFCGKKGIITVTLEDGPTSHIKVFRENPFNGVSVITRFEINSQADLEQNIDFSDNPKIIGSTVERNRLGDYATMYRHTFQALEFAREDLKLNFNHPQLPVKVMGWSVQNTSYNCINATIYINENDSRCNSSDVPMNAEWHEFGHHIMCESAIGGDNQLPPADGEWHNGYDNPTSAASWVEGFAEFCSLKIARYTGEIESGLYYWAGGNHLLDIVNKRYYDHSEMNWDVTDYRKEEFALAGILWDILDADNYTDNQKDDDNVSLTDSQIWSILNQTNISNINDTYWAFRNSGIPSLVNDTDGDGISELDEIFIAHKVFNDTNGNDTYDLGEPVGFTSWPNSTGQVRANRPKVPLVKGSYLYLIVIDSSTGLEINDVIFKNIEKNEDPIYQFYDHNYSINISGLPRLVYYSMQPTLTDANITVIKEGYLESEPLMINSSFYWANLGKEYFLNHTFYLTPANIIPSCPYTINNPGMYVLNQSISSIGTCIQINSSNVILDCQGYAIDGDDTGTDYGVYNFQRSNVTVKNCVITDFSRGIFFYSVSNSNIINNIANSNAEVGIYYYSSSPSVSNSNIINNIANSNSQGIYLVYSGSNNITNNKVSSNSQGIRLDASSNNIITNNNATGNTQWDFSSQEGSLNNNVINLATYQNLVSFTSKDIALKGLTTGPADPTGYKNINKYISATNKSADSWLYLNISYSETDITGINESSLRIWKYNGTWTNETFYTVNNVDVEKNIVYADITSFGSIFAPLGKYAYICGDVNADKIVNVVDVVYLINYLFIDGPEPLPLKSGDVNQDDIVNVVDVVYLINYLFINGPAPCSGKMTLTKTPMPKTYEEAMNLLEKSVSKNMEKNKTLSDAGDFR